MKTDISVLLDRSGSMQLIADDTVGGFNAFLKEQQALPGEAVLTLVQFDSEGYDVILDARPIAEATSLTTETFKPRASTPLLDAMGRLIRDTGARLKAMPESERPEKVVAVIITDGHENASREFKADRVREMVEHQTAVYKWSFIYLGANQDAILVAKAMGISMDTAATYRADSAGTQASYAAASSLVKQARAGVAPQLTMSARLAMLGKRSPDKSKALSR